MAGRFCGAWGGDCTITICVDFQDPVELIPKFVAELGPERKEIEYTQPRRRAGKPHNNWSSLYDAAMLSFTSRTKVGL